MSIFWVSENFKVFFIVSSLRSKFNIGLEIALVGTEDTDDLRNELTFFFAVLAVLLVFESFFSALSFTVFNLFSFLLLSLFSVGHIAVCVGDHIL
jgi:hypothetical protein